MTLQPDYAELTLAGNGHTQDSFSLAVQAAARLLGCEADYETVYCLSSNALAPAIDLGEDCTAWWHVQGWQSDRCIQTVAAAVGLRAERLALPPDNLSPQDAQDVFERKAFQHRKACARIVRARMDAGAVVLTTGGWQVQSAEGFAPWCWWGIITKAPDDGDLRGACLGADPNRSTGFRDRRLDYLGVCWALSRGEVTLDPEEARSVVLRQAVARIRGRGSFEAEARSVYGLAAMDAWIAHMKNVPFCSACAHAGPQGMAGCAVNNVQTTSAGARAAASYLRDAAPESLESARPHLEQAANHYDRTVELLAPATWAFYRDMLNDTERQKAHAENVLVPVKAELAAAADEMEQALVAEMQQRLASADLSGRGSGFERDSFCLAMQEAARILGRSVQYETLLALTTNAFAPGFDRGNDCKELWVANSWVSHTGPLDYAWAHLGLSVEPLSFPEPEEDLDDEDARGAYQRACAARIGEAMARGKVIVVTGGWEHQKGRWVEPWWAGIVTEVTEDGVVLGAHLNGRKDNELVNLPQGEVLAVSLARRSLGEEKMNIALLRSAVARIRAQGKHFRRSEFTAFGLDAMDEWIGQMAREPHFCPTCREKKGEGWQGACTVARAVRHRCREAAAFLHARIDTFPRSARPHVEAAAGHYERIVALLGPATTPGDNGHYETFIGDLDKQKAHAKNVLVPVKAELAAAADAMEKAVAAELGAELTDEQKERLRQWGNLFRFEKMIQVSQSDPVFYELLKMECALDPVRHAAGRLRDAMGRMEPAELTYPAQLDAILEALASGEVPDDILVRGGFDWSSGLWDQRKAQRREHAKELRRWIEDGSGFFAATLGERSDAKVGLVRLTLHELETNGPDTDGIEELRADAELGAFAHRVEMLDGELWSHDRNFDLLVRSIAGLGPIGEWHTRNGPLAWGDAEPACKPKVQAILSRLNAWLAGREDDGLGARDAYPEKVWLARCFATYLRYHLRDYWEWMDRQGAQRVTLNGHEYEFRWVSPRNLEELGLVGDDRIEPRSPKTQYGGHAHPLYNLHCEVRPARPVDELRRELQRQGKTRDELWQEVAEALDVDYFALIAVAEGQLAGHVRFFPADKGLLRRAWVPEAQQTDRSDVLLISAGYVDAEGGENGLDGQLVRRVIAYAREEGYSSVRALGWSDVRAFAMWGETFPVSCFEQLGFRRLASVSGGEDALNDMLAGSHSDWVREQIVAAMADGTTKDQATQLFVLSLSLTRRPEVNREGTRVWVEGVPDLKMTEGWQRLVGIDILLRHRGEQTSFDELLAYSGEAFHLCHGSKWELRTGLSICTDPWANLAQAYGYGWRWTRPNWFHEMTRLDMDQRWQKSSEFLEQLYKDIDAGRPVLLGGAYGECGTWRVVVGYDRDRQQVCYVGGNRAYEWTDLIDEKVKEFGFWDSQVRGPIRPDFYGGWQANAAFLLGEKKASPSEAERRLSALRRAVEMFHTQEFSTGAYGGVTYYFGEKAYEQWSKDLAELDFPGHLEKPGPQVPEWYDMSGMDGQVDAVVTGRSAAANCCERTADHLSAEAGAHLRAAAKHYREEVEIAKSAFGAFLGGIADKERAAWLSEEANCESGAHAISQMLEEERAAIAEIEQALAAIKEHEMKAKVKRDGGRVWIDYVADIDEGCLSGLSHIYRIADVLRYYGEDVDTDWLMGVSGEAFAYYYHPDGTYLSPFVHSWDSALAALEAYGYSGEWEETGRGTGVEPSLRTLESEIEAGRLVIAPGIKASRNGINSRCHWWFVVNGIDVEAKEVSTLEKADGGANFAPLPKGDSADPRAHPRWYGIVRTSVGMDNHYGPRGCDNPLLLVRRAARQPDWRALALGAMERAVKIAREEPVRLTGWGGGEYLAGLAALERLLADLEAAEGDGVGEFARLNPVKGDPFRGIHEELLHLRLLSERRRAAAAFLRKAAEVLPAVRPSVNAAAERYDEVARVALEAFVLRHGAVEENDRICEAARLETYDDNPEWDAYWRRADENLAGADRRKELARLIAGALEAERAAVAEMEKALMAAEEAETLRAQQGHF